MAASYRARCALCPWRLRVAESDLLARDALSAHVARLHRRPS